MYLYTCYTRVLAVLPPLLPCCLLVYSSLVLERQAARRWFRDGGVGNSKPCYPSHGFEKGQTNNSVVKEQDWAMSYELSLCCLYYILARARKRESRKKQLLILQCKSLHTLSIATSALQASSSLVSYSYPSCCYFSNNQCNASAER